MGRARGDVTGALGGSALWRKDLQAAQQSDQLKISLLGICIDMLRSLGMGDRVPSPCPITKYPWEEVRKAFPEAARAVSKARLEHMLPMMGAACADGWRQGRACPRPYTASLLIKHSVLKDENDLQRPRDGRLGHLLLRCHRHWWNSVKLLDRWGR